jgi:hypothetical protein
MNPDKSKNPANPDQKQKSHPFSGWLYDNLSDYIFSLIRADLP